MLILRSWNTFSSCKKKTAFKIRLYHGTSSNFLQFSETSAIEVTADLNGLKAISLLVSELQKNKNNTYFFLPYYCTEVPTFILQNMRYKEI